MRTHTLINSSMTVIKTALVFVLFFKTICGQLVHLPLGTIQGKTSTTAQNTVFFSFEKVPYASPPIGALRFKEPIPPKSWTGIKNCTENRAMCFQVSANSPLETEDCLYLNIYTPEVPSENSLGSDLTVMVYFHGGGFIQGTCLTSECGPDFLLDEGVLIVTVNYRLGPFGFLSTQDEVIPGNNGLKDQFLALKWINSNIHLFGGDPGKITIFGQSAGAASVAYQLLNTNSKGLFRAAILQSGSFLCPWAFQRDAREIAFRTAHFLNGFFNNSQHLLQFLSNTSAEKLDWASFQIYLEENAANRQISQGFFYAPVLEPESDRAFLTEKMYGKFAHGNFVQVPVIVGITSEESLAEAANMKDLMKLFKDYDSNPVYLVPHDLNIKESFERKTAALFVKELYGGKQFQKDISSGIRYSSDNSFTRAVIKQAEIQSKFTDTYFYQFSYDGIMGDVNVTLNGAGKVAHTEDLRYLWRINSERYNNSNIDKYPKNDILMHQRLLRLWTNFAKFLNPTPEPDFLLENVSWPKVSDGKNSEFIYLNIDENLTIQKYPKHYTYVGWNRIYDLFGSGNYDTF